MGAKKKSGDGKGVRGELKRLGAARLAEALAELAERDDSAAELVDRLLATPKENLTRYKRGLAGLKRSKKFVYYRYSFDFANRLENLLALLAAAEPSPEEGFEAILGFFRADEATLGRSDDSSGVIGDVFRISALDLLSDFAKGCSDKEAVADEIFRLAENDGYGVRGKVVARAADFLPPDVARGLAERFLAAFSASRSDSVYSFPLLAAGIAEGLLDVELLETALSSCGREGLLSHDFIRLSRVCLRRGEVDKAEEYFALVGGGVDRDQLEIEMLKAKGDAPALGKKLRGEFKAYPSVSVFNELVALEGENRRGELLSEMLGVIDGDASFNVDSVDFILEFGEVDALDGYVLARSEGVDGRRYDILPDVAKFLERNGRSLSASLVYRALLTSILTNKRYKAYGYAARYLKKLDKLADAIDDWTGFEPHDEFKKRVREEHRLKTSFWAKYDG